MPHSKPWALGSWFCNEGAAEQRDPGQKELTGLWGWRWEPGAWRGTQRPPYTYTVQLALLPQVVRVSELPERVLEVDSDQCSQHRLEKQNITLPHLGDPLLPPILHTPDPGVS